MGMDMVDTGLVLTMGVLKTIFRRDKKLGNDLLLQIYRLHMAISFDSTIAGLKRHLSSAS